jgi:hypothetical protein
MAQKVAAKKNNCCVAFPLARLAEEQDIIQEILFSPAVLLNPPAATTH